MSEILLSICIAGRNDNYGYNFKYRFVQSMNQLAYAAKKANVFEQIEVVFADWNSEVPLASEIVMSEDAAKLVRFVETPPEIAKKYNPSFSPFNQSAAFNTAFRRAKGKFIGLMPGDILFTSWSLRNLILLLQKEESSGTLIAIPRKKIPFQYDESLYFTTPEAVEKILLSGDAFMKTDNEVRGLMGTYGAFFLPRETMFDLRGVDERIAGWGYNDIDLALRCADYIKIINTSGYGISCYDFEPSPLMNRQKKERETSFWPIELGHAQNPEFWGLSGKILQEHSCTRFSEKNIYPYTPAKPESLSLQEWLLILLSSYPVNLVKNISELALAAVVLSITHKLKTISLFGTGENSIITTLGLVNGFPDLLIHKELKEKKQFFQLWENDKKYASIHYQGTIRYIPSMDFSPDEKSEMFIFDSPDVSAETIMARCPPESILLFSSRCSISKADIDRIAVHFHFHIYSGAHIVILSSFILPPETTMRPMTGNFMKKFLASSRITTLSRRIAVIISLLSMCPVVHWVKILRKYCCFRNGTLKK